jgi:diacylglycerol kinase family enzyme
MTPAAARLPAFVNPGGGRAVAASRALRDDDRFDVHEVAPEQLQERIRRVMDAGARRVVVAGGDGTMANAAGALVGSAVELAVIPGGTLNHLARHLGVPTDLAAARELAVTGAARPTDVGRVNGRVFVNTSSVGAYVGFVRMREQLEPWLGYWLSSLVASLRILAQLRTIGVTLQVDGVERHVSTPLVFVGVGERELGREWMLSPQGMRGLHALVVHGRGRARLLVLAFAAAARGTRGAAELPDVDGVVVDRCTVAPRHAGRVALDGELAWLGTPLEYEVLRDALLVVTPAAREAPTG